MALTFPYALDFLAKCLLGQRIPLNLRRNDERSGSGDGRFWSAELAPPLWTASYALYAHGAVKAREINAKIWGLDGMSKTFLWTDPYYKEPAAGEQGLSAATVTVDGIRSDRGAIRMTGLPSPFTLTAGDFVTVTGSSGQVYFGQFAESQNNFTGGTSIMRELRPYLPQWVAVGDPIELLRPYFKAMVTDYMPFASLHGKWGDNASITILQKP